MAEMIPQLNFHAPAGFRQIKGQGTTGTEAWNSVTSLRNKRFSLAGGEAGYTGGKNRAEWGRQADGGQIMRALLWVSALKKVILTATESHGNILELLRQDQVYVWDRHACSIGEMRHLKGVREGRRKVTRSRETTFTHAKNKGDAQSRNFHKELDVFL